MIVVDTSVWIEFLRGRDRTIVEELGALLDEEEIGLPTLVRLELLSGAKRSDLPKLRRVFSALRELRPGAETWELTDAWVERAVHGGQRFGIVDLMIGALAAEHDAPLWSLDSDFAKMERMGFVRRHTRS